jgi:hypothetical protein
MVQLATLTRRLGTVRTLMAISDAPVSPGWPEVFSLRNECQDFVGP